MLIGGDVITYTCPLCGNSDIKYIGYNKRKEPYCRKCISFKGETVSYEVYNHEVYDKYLYIDYELSKEQEKISNQVLENYKNNNNTLIYAVCGAGKTELVYKVIEYSLKENLKVGFAIPRRDVVIELQKRLAKSFIKNKIIALYGGNNNILVGDIIVLTTHQLYRYEKYFDLLILDEIDAFPYRGNDVLYALFKRSVKGNYVLMSATPSEKIIQEFSLEGNQILKLFTRYHKSPLPVPIIKNYFGFLKYIYLIKKIKQFKKENKPLFIFVPTIKEAESLYSIINFFVKGGNFVHSKRKNRGEVINNFRNKKYSFLVTTSVLERGVTLDNLQVVIFNADNEIFSKEALIQISGRVGRTKAHPTGEVIYVATKKSEEMEKSINKIREFNSKL